MRDCHCLSAVLSEMPDAESSTVNRLARHLWMTRTVEQLVENTVWRATAG